MLTNVRAAFVLLLMFLLLCLFYAKLTNNSHVHQDHFTTGDRVIIDDKLSQQTKTTFRRKKTLGEEDSVLSPNTVTSDSDHSYRNDTGHISIKKPRRLFYLRVPKSGSTTFTNISATVCSSPVNHCHYRKVRMLAKICQMHHYSPETHMYKFLDAPEPTYGPGKHLFFLDFAGHGLEMPDYISVIRHPLDHRISLYYCLARHPRYRSRYSNISLDDCVKQRLHLCTDQYQCDSRYMLIRIHLPFFSDLLKC